LHVINGMKRIVLLIVLYFTVGHLVAQPKQYKVFNDWSNVELVDSLTADLLSDSIFAICSNRVFDPTVIEFLGHDNDPDDSIRYFVASFCDGRYWVDRVADLSSIFLYLPREDLVVYAEGMGKTFPKNLQRGSAMATQYGVNVLMFDYPSIHPDKFVFANFYYAYNRAKTSHIAYKNLLVDIVQFKGSGFYKKETGRISAIFHSMGNQIIRNTILSGLNEPADQKIFDNLILNAACVPQRNHQAWVEQIDFAKRIYINYNSKDKQLRLAALITLDKMLGVDPKDPKARNAIYVNFNPLVGDRHSNFLNIKGRDDIPMRAHYYYLSILHGNSTHHENPEFFGSHGDQMVYLKKDEIKTGM